MQSTAPELISGIATSPDSTGVLRILLADDHEILRLGTAIFIKRQLNCEICAETSNGRDALKLAESTRPDVAIIDLGLPGLNGLEVTKQIRRLLPATEVIVLTGDPSSDIITRVFEAGAKAFIFKVDATVHLVEAIKTVSDHRFYLTPEAHQSLQLLKQLKTKTPIRKTPATESLTSREREVVQLLAEGKSNKEVAGLLGISVKTVETHRATIMRKLSLEHLSDLVRYAIRQKIINA